MIPKHYSKYSNLWLIALFYLLLFSNTGYANEIDIEKNAALFQKMFGEEYDKVLATPSKVDDEKFALDLIAGAASLNSNPDLQIYLKWKAAEILANSDKNKKQARDLLIDIKSNLPEDLSKEADKKIFDLQKIILNATPISNKMVYAEEVELFVSQAQVLSNSYLMDSDFANSLLTLKEALRYARLIDKDAAAELNIKVLSVQKDSTRFQQLQIPLKQLTVNPKDEKANLEVLEYYLLERNNLFKAWPYLDNVTNHTVYGPFFHNIKKCISDQSMMTPDEITLPTISVLGYYPEFYLNWLSKKDIVDPEEVIKQQKELLSNNKKIQFSKIKTVIQSTINKHGELQEVPSQIYVSLASNFDSLLELVRLNKKLDEETSRYINGQILSNKYIALMKASVKITKESAAEVDKLKIELEIGKTKKSLKDLKLEEFQIDLATKFSFQQNDSILDKIEVNGEGLYSFDANSWLQFNKDFDITVGGNQFDLKDKKSLLAQDGVLIFNDNKPYMFKSKKRKWSSNIEISFELFKDYEPTKQALDFYILFKPDCVAWQKTFAVHYAFFNRGGWFGTIRDGEGWETFTASKLTKSINGENEKTSFWKTDKIKIVTTIKDKKFEISIDGETIATYPVSEISQEKGFPNTPIQIFFVRRFSPPVLIPVKIDNLYIGPPRTPKK